MQIRLATKADAQKISYLILKNIEHVSENNYTQAQKTAWSKANTKSTIEEKLKKRVMFCAFQNDKLIGTIGILKNEVVGLYISYSKRNLGIGKKLIHHLEDYARKQNIEELVLSATPSANKFYQSLGYHSPKPVNVIINNVLFEETEMRKTITSKKT